MSYFTQLVIASYINAVGIEVIVREGLNNKSNWELALIIPKYLWSLYDDNSQYVYEERDGLFYAKDPRTGRVSYFHHTSPGNGFGGSTYNLKMVDGTTRALKGPWSSRAECMNQVGFTPCKEVTIQGKYNMADNMTMAEINKLLLPLGMECILIENRCHIIRL